MKNNKHKCDICGKDFSPREIVRGALVRDPVADLIRHEHPTWSENSYICTQDLKKYRATYVHSILESEKGELTVLEREVLESLQKHEILSSNVDAMFEKEWSFGGKRSFSDVPP